MAMESGLKRSLLASAVFHGLIVVAAYVTLPRLQSDLPPDEQVFAVDLVNIADVTNAPKPQPKPEVKPKPQAEPEPPPPAPDVTASKDVPETSPASAPKSEPQPAPAPEPPPEPKVAVLPPPPEPKPEPKPAAAPKPEPTPEPQPKPELPKPEAAVSQTLAEAKPVRKPAPPSPPDPFASVLKTLEDLKSQPPTPDTETKKPEKKVAEKQSFEDQIAEALKVASTKQRDLSKPISISTLEAVAQQLRGCWIVPAGIKGAKDLVVEIKVDMNPDATVGNAEIVNASRALSDRAYRAAAESALRATKNPRCQPLPLPLDQYQQWRTMTLNFDPRDML